MKSKLPLLLLSTCLFFLPNMLEAQSSYCTPKYSGNGYQNTGNPTAFFTHVLRMAVANVDKQVAAPASALTNQIYYDYTGTDTVKLTQTATYPLTIELGNGANRQTVAVWVDYNQNGTFESTEIVWSRTDIENQGDHKYLASFTVPKNALLGNTRMRVGTIYGNNIANPCTNKRADNFPSFIADWSQHFQDYSVTIVKPTVQIFQSVTLSHTNFNEVEPGTIDNDILRIEVNTNEDGTLSPLNVDSLYFSLLGNTNLADIKSATLYYTGKNPSFHTNNPMDTVLNPGTNFTMTSKRDLRNGTNYFWLAYDISNDALIGNAIDARCNGVHVVTKRVPANVSPPGQRNVGYCVSRGNRSMFVYVRWVRFNTISVLSGFSNTGYQNNTFRNTTVKRQDSIPLSIDVGNSVNNSFTKAWIDFNADGDFDDANELVLFDSITTANTTPTFGPVTKMVYIPANAKVGPTRMRITSASKADQSPWKLAPEPCDKEVEIGEVEDYTVIISEEGEPVAEFGSSTSCLGDTTYFKDASYTFSIYSINSWNWDFGDGNSSTTQNPKHVYTKAGTYKVRLIVNTNKPGTPDTTYQIVQVESPKPDFSVNTTLSKTPITFNDASSGGTIVLSEWNFGDPTSLSNIGFGPTVTHQYDTAKTFTVTLKVRTVGGCVDSIKKTIRIVDELKPVAIFSASEFEPYRTAPLQLQDLSVNRPSKWKWSITPGTHKFISGGATAQNPVVTLDALTNYTIKLVVENSAGKDSTTRSFTTKAYKAPTADFNANQTVVKAGQIVSFLDASTNDPTKWEWVFGDGDTSRLSNPIHQYVKTGTYSVELAIENPAGKDSKTKTNYIEVSDEYVMCENDVTNSPLYKGTLYDDGGASSNYGNNTGCGFLINPPCAGTITLVFTEFAYDFGDVVKVYDGYDETGIPLHTQSGFTGYTKPAVLKANSGAMYIVQETSTFGDTTGFKATWSATNNIKPIATLKGANQGFVGGQAYYENTTKVGASGAIVEWFYNGKLVDKDVDQYLMKYGASGTDTLVLRVSNCAGSDTAMKVIKVDNPTTKPTANFAKSDTNRVFVLDVVSLVDLSNNGPDEWLWEIGGDPADYLLVNATSDADQNIEVIFFTPGYYTIKLTAKNSFGSDVQTKVAYILVEPQASMCSFPLSTDAPAGRITDDGGVGFPYSSRNCDFLIDPCAEQVILEFITDSFDYAPGDLLRVYDGLDATGIPLHSGTGFAFNNPPKGKYIAKSGAMFIIHSSLGNPQAAQGFIADWKVVPYNNPLIGFEIPDTAYTGGNFVLFRNTTDERDNPEVNYRWDFDNDGKYDDSSSFEPTYKFSTAGTVEVKLLVEACGFKDSLIKTIRILKPKAKPKAKFNVSNVHPSTADLVSFKDYSTNGPNEYKWVISPANFTITAGSDTLPFMDGFFNVADTYDVKLVVRNQFGADSLIKQKHIIVVEYCEPVVVNAPVDELSITYVNLVDISQRSNPSDGNYNNYTSVSTKLTAGGTHPFILQRGGRAPSANLKVWIDLNRDGDFTDTLEEVLSIPSGSWEILVDSIRVPRTASAGATRMRLSLALGTSSNTPCGSKDFGEYEDYLVVIGTDEIAPVITLLGSATEFIELGDSYTDPGTTAFDNLDGNITSLIVTSNNVDTANAGQYRITYDVSDLSGNKAKQVERKVIVTGDTTRPVITLVGGDTVKMDVYTSYVEPGYNSLDNWDGDVTSLVVSNPGVIDTFRLDTFEVQYTSVDLSNNESQAYRYVIVQDTMKPVITLKGAANMVIDSGTVYVEDSASLTDNYWDNMILIISGQVKINKPGIYKIYYDAADFSGNSALQKVRTVEVKRVVGLDEVDGLSKFDVYPNPTSSFVTADFVYKQNTKANLKVTNSLGQVVSQMSIGLGGATQQQIDVRNFESGVYYIELMVDGNVARKRFTVVR